MRLLWWLWGGWMLQVLLGSSQSSFLVAADLLEENLDDRPRILRSLHETNTTQVKLLLNQALLNMSSPQKVVSVVRRHRRGLLVGVAVVAFRRELAHLVRSLLQRRVVDPETGKTVYIPLVRFNVTTLLQGIVLAALLLTLHQQRRDQQWSMLDSDEASPIMSILPLLFLLPGKQSPTSLLFLSRFLLSSGVFLPPIEQHYSFENLEHRYLKDGLALRKTLRAGRGNRTFSMDSKKGTVVVVDMTKLDSGLSQLVRIRDQVSFLISDACRNALGPDKELSEVAIVLESPGGAAADYALAAQQLLRLRQSVRLTIIVDKVAASGGYMMACAASRLVAAPMAVVGSIGVMGQVVNFQKFLESYGVQALTFRAGKDKVPVGALGPVTKEGMDIVQRMMDRTHVAFMRHVTEARPALADRIEEIATGQVWLGQDALELGLVDELGTSDEYLAERLRTAHVLKLVSVRQPKGPFQRPGVEGASFQSLLHRFSVQWLLVLRSTIESALSRVGGDKAGLLCSRSAYSTSADLYASNSH